MMWLRNLICLGLLCGLLGCQNSGGGSEGSADAAKAYYQAEFQKWMAGEPNAASTMDSRLSNYKPPVGHRILTVNPTSADILAVGETDQPMEVWGKWKTYRLGVEIESLSKAGTPLKKVVTYTLCWDGVHKQWLIKERF